MSNLLYGGYVRTLSEKFERRLDDIASEFNFELGDEFEIAICEILRSFLPNKYGICRGFIVNAKGDKRGDDIIIYDQERFPTLKINPKENFSRLEAIPIEAVYAYIEAKHTLNKESFDKALEQIIEVKKLCSQREKKAINQYDNYVREKSHITVPECLPDYRNPVFTMIMSRYSINKDTKKRSDNEDDIEAFLASKFKDIKDKDFLPDLIVAGKSNLICPVIDTNNIPKVITKFYLANNPTARHASIKKHNVAFGMALSYLMAALDFINLGKMPWEDIINDVKNN